MQNLCPPLRHGRLGVARSFGAQVLHEAVEGAWEITTDAPGEVRAGRAAKEHHEREGVGTQREKVYQAMLMDPVDLAKLTANPVARDGKLVPPGREAHLHGGLLGRARNAAKEQAYAAGRDRLGVASAEERPDEPALPQASRARQRVAPRRPGHLPGLESLTDRRFRPLARRRFRTARPSLDFIRARNPCVRARLMRLG